MILVFGQSGQVARELARLEPGARFLARTDADLGDPDACAAAVRRFGPSAVINAAAYTAVDLAESEEELATFVNGVAPGAMATACAELGIPFIHLSTEYVFDGAGTTPFATDARMAPANAYGRSKVVGEEAVRASGAPYAILRTSWVFSAHGNNFVKTMLRLAETRDHIPVVDDQIGGPTPAGAIAEACLTLIDQLQRDPGKSGTYHLAGTPYVSRADFAREIFSRAGREAVVDGIPTHAYPTPATRPPNSRLDCAGLGEIGLARPDWKAALTRALAELEQQ
jgi:dTDP-4-dehydrorhamnose reductase